MTDEPDLEREGAEFAELLCDRLADWAESNLDTESTVTGFDIGVNAEVAASFLHVSTRPLVIEAVDRILTEDDLSEIAQVRLHDLRALIGAAE